MIPKIIHYCWFGCGEKSSLTQKCIDSWKKHCPDYQIIEWNESNFDFSESDYAKYCYEHKKYAFLSDYVRLVIVEKYGGIYLDTDVEVVKSLDDLLVYDAFYGFESNQYVNTGQGFGAIKKHSTVSALLAEYNKLIPDEKGDYPIANCPIFNTRALIPFGLVLSGKYQLIDNIAILPVEYMNPYDDQTGKLNKTQNTISIHWYSKSWLDKKSVWRSRITKPIHRIFGVNCFEWLKRKKRN